MDMLLYNRTGYQQDPYPLGDWEPFFENERVAELGFSLERALFEGPVSRIIKFQKEPKLSVSPETLAWGLPVMGLVAQPTSGWRLAWTLKNRIDKSASVVIRQALVYGNGEEFDDDKRRNFEAQNQSWPIPVRWIEKFHKDEFWQTARGFTGHNFKIPRIIGISMKRKRWRVITGEEFKNLGGIAPGGVFAGEPYNTNDMQPRLNDEDTIKRFAIRTALRNRADAKVLKKWQITPYEFREFTPPREPGPTLARCTSHPRQIIPEVPSTTLYQRSNLDQTRAGPAQTKRMSVERENEAREKEIKRQRRSGVVGVENLRRET